MKTYPSLTNFHLQSLYCAIGFWITRPRNLRRRRRPRASRTAGADGHQRVQQLKVSGGGSGREGGGGKQGRTGS
eukprot:361118-Chlamydomonas_euryale.AAC.4